MRKGLLFAIVVCMAVGLSHPGSLALAQAPYYGPMPYPMAPGYGPRMPYNPGYPAPGYGGYQSRGVLIGGPLSANGPVRLDSFRHARPVSPEEARMPLRAVYPNRPRPVVRRPAPQIATKQCVIQHTSRKFAPNAKPGADPNLNTLPPLPNGVAKNTKNAGTQAISYTDDPYGVPAGVPSGNNTASPYVPCDDCMEVPPEILDDAYFEEPAFAGGDWLDHPYPERFPRGYKFYGNLEVLHVWWDEQDVPPLLNLVSPGNAPVVIGNGAVPGDDGNRQGARATVGVWLNRRNTWGIEATGMFLLRDSTNASYQANANNGVVRLFVNPNGTPGAVAVNQASIGTTQEAWGAEANLRRELHRGCWGHLDLIGGMRFFTLREDLIVSDLTTAAGSLTRRADFFGTVNRLYTGQIGLDSEVRLGRLYANIWGKCAIGANEQNLTINGGTSVTGAVNANAPTGLLTGASNIGNRSDNDLAVIAEAGLRLGVLVTNNIRVSGGYNIMHISSVIRPGDQVDFAGNIIPTNPPRPLVLFRDSSIWAHILSAELEWRF